MLLYFYGIPDVFHVMRNEAGHSAIQDLDAPWLYLCQIAQVISFITFIYAVCGNFALLLLATHDGPVRLVIEPST
jgi:hypothetical protein